MSRSAQVSASPHISMQTAVSAVSALFVFSVHSILFPAALHAQGWIEIARPEESRGAAEVVRVASQVHIQVDGRIARVEVEERFKNTGGRVSEGAYLYPMPFEAVFTNFSLWMGDQEIRGEAMDAEQARAIYEEIVRRRKDPALLTLAGHGLIRAQVFPIEPGDTRKVVLRYTQFLPRDGDALRLRYSFGSRGATSESGFQIVVSQAADFGTPYSPTHQISSQRSGDRLEISIAGELRDELQLFLPLRHGLVGTSLVTHAPGGEDGYFMLLLAPAPADTGVGLARDLTLVMDISGSMSGTKLEQAKAAMEQALATLSPRDRFRLIAFSSSVRRFREEFVTATRDQLASAREFIDRLGAEGGTNIAGALEAALDRSEDPERLSLVLFVTDGLPSIGEQAPDRIAEAAASHIGRARVFTVGIGPDVNTYLLDRLATAGRGASEYVSSGASVETAMGSILAKLRFPALVDLRIADSPVKLTQTTPSQLPDLFFGEELVVFGRYRGQGSGTVVVTGQRNGHSERLSVPAKFPASESQNDFIPRLWAARQIGELTRQIRLEGAADGLVSQVRELGLRYGIVTEYTSYLVQEPTSVAGPVPLREDLIGGPQAAAAQTGVEAVRRAAASAKLSDSRTLASADAAAADRLESLAPQGSAFPSRRAGGRLFVRRGRVWTDVSQPDRITITDIAAYSRAYFELVRVLPEITPCLAVGDEILIAGRRVGVHIGPSGIEVWKPGELTDLVRNFRGT